MPDGGEPTAVKLIGAIGEIAAGQWDACAGAANPFLAHAFLRAIEDSGSVGGDTGWQPAHVAVEDRAGTLLAAAPAYLKSHSYGEYVFDHGWAEAYERAGGRYYPKLLVAVPFTPVPGPRLLVRDGPGAPVARQALIDGLMRAAQRFGVSSVHVNFATETDAGALQAAGFMERLGLQYHWSNRGYRDFDDFLAALASRKRKAIRKERREVAGSGVVLRRLTGAAIEPGHWDAFHRMYLATGGRKWGSPYLTRDFFHRLGAAMAERVLLVLAEHDGEAVAGALNLIGADALYGRNWGCLADYRFLHFEACYYQAIEFAIERRLARVEAGAQGEHKIQRGYLPVFTRSLHWIADPGFAAAVEDFLKRERRAVERDAAALGRCSPYRQSEQDRGFREN